jgi:hypothetical protein
MRIAPRFSFVNPKAQKNLMIRVLGEHLAGEGLRGQFTKGKAMVTGQLVAAFFSIFR